MNILLEVIYLEMLFFRKEKKSYFAIHRFLNMAMKNQIMDIQLKDSIFLEQVRISKLGIFYSSTFAFEFLKIFIFYNL